MLEEVQMEQARLARTDVLQAHKEAASLQQQQQQKQEDREGPHLSTATYIESSSSGRVCSFAILHRPRKLSALDTMLAVEVGCVGRVNSTEGPGNRTANKDV